MSNDSLALICVVVLGCTYFVWPIYHAIRGSDRKEKMLKKMFLGLSTVSVLCGLGIVFQLRRGYPTPEGVPGYLTVIYLSAAICLLGSIAVLVFVSKG